MTYAIALEPSAQDVRACIALQAGCALEWHPRLDADRVRPHVSLFHNTFPDRDAVVAACDRLVREHRRDLAAPLELGPLLVREPGWLWIEVTATDALRRAHEATLEASLPLLGAERSAPSAPPAAMRPEERASWVRYGYRFAGDAFRPHVTVANLARHRQRLGDRDRGALEDRWADLRPVTATPPSRLLLFLTGEDGERVAGVAQWELG